MGMSCASLVARDDECECRMGLETKRWLCRHCYATFHNAGSTQQLEHEARLTAMQHVCQATEPIAFTPSGRRVWGSLKLS